LYITRTTKIEEKVSKNGLGQKPTFFSIFFLNKNFLFSINNKKKWESGLKP